ncbi:hypothetical protein [Aquabacterium sp.]|uniref:hypothetical protein n=1 Tax=Aquabacterium sp. TaxID=1872578 RepID=UPI0035B29E64
MFALLRGAVVVTAWATLGISGAVLAAGSELHHDHHAAQPGEVKLRALKPGEKWPTDETLRKGMEAVRSAVVAAQADATANRLDAAGYGRLADSLDQQLAAIVRGCKLTPEADAAFHSVVLGPLTHDAGTMRGSPKIEIKKVALMGITQTLRHYGEYFQHPGWDANRAPAP